MSLVGPLPLPAGTRRRFVPVPGGPLAVLEHDGSGHDGCGHDGSGHDGSGQHSRAAGRRAPVVLVPGFTGSKEDFRLLFAPLAATGRHVLALDQRGQYESAGPNDLAAYGVQALATDLLDLLTTLDGGPVHLVGHSFGGLVCRAVVLRRPDVARSLTLMCSGPQALTGPRVELLPLMAPVLEQGGMPALVAAVDAMGAADPRTQELDPEVREFLRVRMLASAPAGLLGMAAALTSEPDRVAALRATGIALLVLHGAADDAWSPAVQADMAERLGARYVVVPDAVHSPAVENPGPTAQALVTFFDDVERSADRVA